MKVTSFGAVEVNGPRGYQVEPEIPCGGERLSPGETEKSVTSLEAVDMNVPWGNARDA